MELDASAALPRETTMTEEPNNLRWARWLKSFSTPWCVHFFFHQALFKKQLQSDGTGFTNQIASNTAFNFLLGGSIDPMRFGVSRPTKVIAASDKNESASIANPRIFPGEFVLVARWTVCAEGHNFRAENSSASTASNGSAPPLLEFTEPLYWMLKTELPVPVSLEGSRRL